MAKLSKRSLSEFDQALDQLGGGALPIARPPARKRRVAKSRKTAKAKPRKTAKAKARAKKR